MSQNSTVHVRKDVLKSDAFKIDQNAEFIPKPKFKGRHLAREHFRTITVNGQVYSDCLVKNCGQRLKGSHPGHLSQHVLNRHKLIDLHADPFGGRSVDEHVTDDTTDPFNEIDMSQDKELGNHESIEVQIRNIVVEGNLRNVQSAEDAGKECKTKHVRDYFELLKDKDMVYSKCLVDNCGRLLSGNHTTNLKMHLIRAHKIKASTRPLRVGQNLKTCRLCFLSSYSCRHIFLDKLNIAPVIRLHFPTKEVNENDGLPNVVCTKCWTKLSHFHQFYRDVLKAEMKFLVKRKSEAGKVGNDRIAVNTNEIEIVRCKDEPPETDESDENSQSLDNEFDNSSNYPFDNEHITSEAANDQRDFDAIFLEEFGADGELNMEKEAPVEVFMEQSKPESIAAAHIPVPSSSREKRKSPKFATEARKRPAELVNVDLICRYCGESFLTPNEIDLHHRKYHFISKQGDREEAIEKRVKR